jgi:hypothetical protein
MQEAMKNLQKYDSKPAEEQDLSVSELLKQLEKKGHKV